MSKNIKLETVIRSLQNKGVKIYVKEELISLKSAEGLGNKCFGYLDYFKDQGFTLVDTGSMHKSDGKFYPKDEPVVKRDKPVETKKKEKRWHSYAEPEIIKERCSERLHLDEINHFQSKINREYLYAKTKADRKQLKDLKKNLSIPFIGQKIYSSEFNPKDIPTNK